jgi:phosphoglycolate phosphatase-like HAD superfamily hydrolase
VRGLAPLAGIDAAIIDLDGTLVDTLGDFVQALNLMLGDLALASRPQVDRKTVEPMIGKGSENLIKSVLNKFADQLIIDQTASESIAVGESEVFELFHFHINRVIIVESELQGFHDGPNCTWGRIC